MLKKILVVDDDFLIRKWLCLLIQQSQKCQAEIFQAENGQKALDILNQETVDLVITDIKMPLVDGVELVRQIHKMNTPPQVAVLSAYDDYNYVRATLKEGVLDYLLKGEIELHDIDALLELAERGLIRNTSPETAAIENEWNYGQISRMFCECLENPDGSLELFLEQAYGKKPLFPIESLACCIKCPQSFEGSSSDILLRLKKTCKQQEIDCLLLPYKFGMFFLLHYKQNESEGDRFSTELVHQLSEALEKSLNGCDITGIDQHCILDAMQLRPVICKQIDAVLRMNFYQVNRLPALQTPNQELAFLAAFKGDISSAIQKKQYVIARNLFQEMAFKCFEQVINPKLFINGCIAVCYQMSAYIQNFMSNAHLALVEDTVFQLQRAETAQESRDIMLSFMDYIQDAAQKHPRYSPAIEKSIDYISSHYSEKLSLEKVSSYVYLNKSYFSELFKKETGINYNDYINQVRIQKACELMEDGHYTLSNVAQMVGFSDQNYFSKIFKRMVGESPKSYQKTLKNTSR